jgi:FdhE protein
MSQNLESIASKVKAIGKRNPVYAEIAQWVGDLLSETVQAAGKFRLTELNLDQAPSQEARSQGRSFLDPANLSLDWKQAGVLYKRLVELVKKRKEGYRQAEGLLRAVDETQDGVPALMKAAMTSDFNAIEAAAKKFKIDPPVLALLLRLSLRPALLNVAQTVIEDLDLSQWTYGHCPVCGSAPGLADLSGEGGKRSLHCSLCETVWAYPRLQCPFCENNNREDLSYLRAENEEGLRVDLCSRCGNYLKTIDLRELPGTVIVPLDDVATWHLDIIADNNIESKKAISSRAT